MSRAARNFCLAVGERSKRLPRSRVLLWPCCLGVLLGLTSLKATAESSEAVFDGANKLYEQGKYAEAATAYEQLAKTGRISEALFFNWGNALFKGGKIGQAIAAYRQAEGLAPRDPDVRANLQFARNQVQGSTLKPDAISLWLGRLSLNEWAWLAAGSLWSWLLLLAATQLRPALKSVLKSYVVALAILTAVAAALCGTDFYLSRVVAKAIVIAPETTARLAPLDESQTAFLLHDGAEVLVLDQKDQWLQVQVDSRRTGWVHAEAVKREP